MKSLPSDVSDVITLKPSSLRKRRRDVRQSSTSLFENPGRMDSSVPAVTRTGMSYGLDDSVLFLVKFQRAWYVVGGEVVGELEP